MIVCQKREVPTQWRVKVKNSHFPIARCGQFEDRVHFLRIGESCGSVPGTRCVKKSVLRFLRGPMRVALEEIVAGYRSHNMTRQERGWKLFLLFPRMLHRGPRGGGIPTAKLLERFGCS